MVIFKSAATWFWGVAFAVAVYVSFALSAVGSTNPRPGASTSITPWVLLAIALCAAASTIWRNRASLAQSAWPMRFVRGVGGVLGTWFVLLLCLIPALVLLPMHGDYTSRAKYSELILSASGVRTEITERALQKRSLVGAGEGVRFEPQGKITTSVLVSPNGIVIGYSEMLAAVVVLIPKMDGEKMTWSCTGLPRKILPGSCRDAGPLPVQTTLERRIEGSDAAHATALRGLALPLQAEIAAAIREGKTLANVVPERQLRVSDPLDFGYLSANGTIVLYSDRHGVYLQLTPSINGSELGWQCVAYPASTAVNACRT